MFQEEKCKGEGFPVCLLPEGGENLRGRGFFLEMQNFELFRDMGIDDDKSYKSCLLSPPITNLTHSKNNNHCKLFYVTVWCILVAFFER